MNIKNIATLILLAVIITLSGCGSTKVYTADKTMVYKTDLYNLANVQKLGSNIEGTLADGEKVNMLGMDKKAVNNLFDKHDSLVVKTAITMDDQELVYQNVRISKYSDFSKMVKNQESAMKKINKFMADKKKTQLKLK